MTSATNMYLTVTDAAALLGMSRQNFNKRYKKLLKPYRVGIHSNARIRYLRADVLALVNPAPPSNSINNPRG